MLPVSSRPPAPLPASVATTPTDPADPRYISDGSVPAAPGARSYHTAQRIPARATGGRIQPAEDGYRWHFAPSTAERLNIFCCGGNEISAEPSPPLLRSTRIGICIGASIAGVFITGGLIAWGVYSALDN